MEAIAKSAKWLADSGGLNFIFLYDDFDRSRFIAGIANTLMLSGGCIVLSLTMGLAGAYAITERVPVVATFFKILVRFCRNTPPLLLLYLCYFGLASVAVRAAGPQAAWLVGSGFAWAMIAISLYIGAFNVESLRAGIEGVSPSLKQASQALGLSRRETFMLVVLPLGFRTALPSLTNNLVELVKTTAYGYALGVAEILYVSSQIWADNLNVMEMMITLFVVFMVLIGALVSIMSLIEWRLRIPAQ
jgi:polar amino acid transport system permease protein